MRIGEGGGPLPEHAGPAALRERDARERRHTTLTLVRHGDPDWAPGGGPAVDDPGLTPFGRRQADAVAAALARTPLDFLYVSPYLRARETAEPIARATGRTARVVPGLAEIGVAVAGLTQEDVDRYFEAGSRRPLREHWDGWPGAESFHDFHARVTGALGQRARGARHPRDARARLHGVERTRGARLDRDRRARRHQLRAAHAPARRAPGAVGVAALREPARRLLGCRGAPARRARLGVVAPELQRGGPPTRSRPAVALALALLVASAACGESFFDARVVAVKDGDSIEVVRDASGREEALEIRLFGVDAPERGQPWSRRAREALSRRVFGKEVRINAVTTDKYDRTVGEVYADDVCVACELLREGHVWVYRQYTKDPVLLGLEAEAQAAHRGLWSLPEAQVPPWEWRRGRRESVVPLPAAELEGSSLACGGKTYCREMRSCAEARFHLAQCGLTRLDGDGDGIPCETLCSR